MTHLLVWSLSPVGTLLNAGLLFVTLSLWERAGTGRCCG